MADEASAAPMPEQPEPEQPEPEQPEPEPEQPQAEATAVDVGALEVRCACWLLRAGPMAAEWLRSQLESIVARSAGADRARADRDR
eukprot:SAG31_NODE_1324_length_8789_cov_2.736249_1_plen_86_part_00